MGCGTVCTMNTIASSLATIPNLTIYEGKKRLPENVNIEESLLRAKTAEVYGFFAYDIKSRQARSQTQMGSLEIEGILEVYVPSDTDTTLSSAYALAESIVDALNWEKSFRDCGTRPTLVEYRTAADELDDKILQFIYTAIYSIGPTCGTE